MEKRPCKKFWILEEKKRTCRKFWICKSQKNEAFFQVFWNTIPKIESVFETISMRTYLKWRKVTIIILIQHPHQIQSYTKCTLLRYHQKRGNWRELPAFIAASHFFFPSQILPRRTVGVALNAQTVSNAFCICVWLFCFGYLLSWNQFHARPNVSTKSRYGKKTQSLPTLMWNSAQKRSTFVLNLFRKFHSNSQMKICNWWFLTGHGPSNRVGPHTGDRIVTRTQKV